MNSQNNNIDALNNTFVSLQRFYSRQSHWLDNKKFGLWANTFTNDGVFTISERSEKSPGNIMAAAEQHEVSQRETILRRFHYINSIDIIESDADFKSVKVAAYAMVHTMFHDGNSDIRSMLMLDHLESDEGEFKIKLREVHSCESVPDYIN